jgi:Ser/Thr protein kinase RdoA (MazF antagonist)
VNDKIIEIAILNHPDREASVKLVSIEDRKYVLKTDSLREIAAQRFFNHQLAKHHLPSLEVHAHAKLQPNQLLLEYVVDSPTLGNDLTEERCRSWGSLVAKMHQVTSSEFMILDGHGEQEVATWQSYIQDYIANTVAYHRNLPRSLGDELTTKIEAILQQLTTYQPSMYSLTHGDLHVHNVLIKDNTLVLFDKLADFLVAPAAFDLGVVYSEGFGGAAYPELGFSTTQQQKFFNAFQEGYGALPAEPEKWLDYFTLLRAFYRWPNRWAPHSGEVIRLLVEKLERNS